MFVFRIQEGTFPPILAFAPMRLSVFTARPESIYRKKFTKTWFGTSIFIRRGITHIGLLMDQKGPSGGYMVVHNIGRGPQMEDVLFDWKVIGHYRYYGPATR